ncbi:unnamed protein product [Penicillium egyptiacum]|uniref:Uncharacterized protein n=1 Tax=Penicillium egyptiacum TaxID=1303716 RepID=A0A9W4KKA8_9EURO|nr:unnamed protein product [Penicillium egyptiacum]
MDRSVGLISFKATLKELSSVYDHKNFKAATGGDLVTAGSMSEDDWALVLRNTNFLSGQRIVFSMNANGSRTFQRLDKGPLANFKIPHYAVTDDSYVNVFETASALSNSVAKSHFSQTDIEISA